MLRGSQSRYASRILEGTTIHVIRGRSTSRHAIRITLARLREGGELDNILSLAAETAGLWLNRRLPHCV